VRRPRGVPPTRSATIGSVLLAVATASCSSSFGMPDGGTQQGSDIFHLWRIFFISAIVVGGIVYALIAWSLIRYRRRARDADDDLGAQFRVHIPLEVVYTAIPVAIVVMLFAFSSHTEREVDRVVPDPGVVIHALAYDWGWRFTYDEPGERSFSVVSEPSGAGVPGPVIDMPRGQTVRIVLTSNDVIHAFWVPGFLFKRDAIPGRVSEFDLTPSVNGTYRGVCAEFCGINHSYMVFTVNVVEPATYASWVASQSSSAEVSP
jgi:cytochrome c oxidase subunit 2